MPGSEQGGGINKSLDWLLLVLKEACVSKMQRHREMFLPEILPGKWGGELSEGDVCLSCRLVPISTILSLVLKIVYHQLLESND